MMSYDLIQGIENQQNFFQMLKMVILLLLQNQKEAQAQQGVPFFIKIQKITFIYAYNHQYYHNFHIFSLLIVNNFISQTFLQIQSFRLSIIIFDMILSTIILEGLFRQQMKQIAFISRKETLGDTLLNLTPKFETLLSFLSKEVQESLSNADRAYCADSFLLRNQVVIEVQLDEPPKSIQQLLEIVGIELLRRINKPYVQCLGQQLKDFKLKTRNLNFGRAIIQTSPTFRTLFATMPHNQFCHLLLNYAIIVPYHGEHIQVSGRLLNQRFNMKAIGARRTPNETSSQPLKDAKQDKDAKQVMKPPIQIKNPKVYTKSLSYSTFPIHRFQIFYCSDMNRSPGLFARNIFFDKGQQKSKFIYETGRLVKKCIQEYFCTKVALKEKHINSLTPILTDLFQSVRDIMNVREFGHKYTSRFSLLLSRYCRLSNDYDSLKKRVRDYVSGTETNVNALFDDLYAEYSQYEQVQGLIAEVIRLAVPDAFLGARNKRIFLSMLRAFINMKRFENYKMEDFLTRMDAFEIQWVHCNYNPKYHRKIITKRRKLLALAIGWIINQLVVPMIKMNFYVTEKHKEANRIFYFRKPIWTLISKTALKRFSQENLERVEKQQILSMKRQLMDIYPQGKLRILPKKGTFRPIITFNRKIEFTSETNSKHKLKANLNQILADTQLVLRNLKNILPQRGYCIFDNRQIARKYDAFVKKWRKAGQPPLKYFTVDIHKCYDSIDTSKLLKIIEESPLIDDLYLVIKYNRLYRNKKAVFGTTTPFTGYFNYKERVSAVPLKDDPMQLRQENSIPSINIFPGKQRLITKEAIIQKLRRICSGSIVNYKKMSWLQKLGIPQGLNVSGVLCSLYFSVLQEQFIKVKDGLLMRLTDDYLYIGPQNEACRVLDSLMYCAEQNGFQFSMDKVSKNFEHPINNKVSQSKEIVWIGKRINIETLEMTPNFEMNDRVGYAMNVNLDRNKLKRFLKNKLKSLLTNHFAAYFKPTLFSYPHLASNARLYMRMSLQKFYPFIQQLTTQGFDSVPELILKVLKSCIHEFLVFACMLAEHNHTDSFYYKLYVQVGEEVVAFFRRKGSDSHLRSIPKIFQQNVNLIGSKLQELIRKQQNLQ